MKTVIYIDVLIFLNIIITFLLLLCSARLMKLTVSPLRFVIGSLLGGASSLMILAPDMGLLLSLLSKFVLSVILVVATYNPKNIRSIIRQTGYFFSVSFIFAGIMLFISSVPSVSLIQYKNGVTYADFSFGSIIAASVVCYIVTAVLNRITRHKNAVHYNYNADIITEKGTMSESALLDTGNRLTDPFTGESVIVINRTAAEKIIPDNIKKYLESGIDGCAGIRLIPYSAVSEKGLLPCFRAEKVIIEGEKHKYILKKPEIAVCENLMDAKIILSPEMLDNPERSKKNAETVR